MTPAGGRVLLVDDHALFTLGLEHALRARGLEAATAPLVSHEQLVALVQRDRPDVVLLDLDLGEPVGDGTALVEPFASAGSRVVVVTGSRQLHRIGAALELGAVDHATKEESFATLLDRVLAVVAGDVPRPGHERRHHALRCLAVHRERESERLGPLESLTPRERTVLLGLTRGRTVAQIAAAEWLSENTVRTHIRGILHKLDVASQTQAVALALRSGWVAEIDRGGDAP